MEEQEHLKGCETETVPGKSFVTRPDYPPEEKAMLDARDSSGYRPLTYLGCPYSCEDPAEKEWRYKQVTLAASWLTAERGLTVFSPITHSHPMHTLGGCDGDWKCWERIDREYLAVSKELIVLLLEGWDKSVGLFAEIKIAKEAGLLVRYLLPLIDSGYVLVHDPSGYYPRRYDRAALLNAVPPLSVKVPSGMMDAAPPLTMKVPAGMTNPKDLIGDTKPQLHLVPSTALVRCAKVMELGAKKYGTYNWRGNKVRRTVYISAAMRHLAQDLDGEQTDPESLQTHLAHAMACCAILIDAMETGNLIDDRPPVGATAKLIRELTVKKT